MLYYAIDNAICYMPLIILYIDMLQIMTAKFLNANERSYKIKKGERTE